MKYSAQAYPKFKRTEEKNKPEQYYCENEVWQNKTEKKLKQIIVEQKKEKKLQKKPHITTHEHTYTPMSIRRKQKTQKNC